MIGKKIGKLLVQGYDIKNKTYKCLCNCGNLYNAKKSFLVDGNKIHECGSCRIKRENESFLGIHGNREIISGAKYIKTKRVVDAKCLLCGNIYNDIGLYGILERKSGCIKCNTALKNKANTKDYSSYIGKILGNIEILGYNHNDRTFDSKCICGKIFTSSVYSIINGHTRSCGCLKNKESKHANKIEDLLGIKFGKLTLIGEDVEYNKNRNKSKQVKKYIFECDCGRGRTISCPLFDVKNGITNSCGCQRSKQQIEFGDFLKSIGIFFSENDKSLGFEIDFLLNEYRLGIEYNGVRWHSVSPEIEAEERKAGKRGYTKRKQYRKKIGAHEKGINLIHIWEDEWLNKQEIVKSMIRNKVGLSKKIYARKCKIVDISQQQFNDFCDNNHIQGKTSSTKHRYGLEYNGELVSVMGFNGKHELNRFCSILNHNVVGGFQKLLHNYIKIYSPKQIVSFAALDVVNIDNNVYSKNGFIKTGKVDISYFYVKSEKKISNRYHKSVFRKEKIVKKFGYKFKEGETEYDAMDKLGYYRCYNSGIQKYVLDL